MSSFLLDSGTELRPLAPTPISLTLAAGLLGAAALTCGQPVARAVASGGEAVKSMLLPAGLPMHDTFDALNNTCRDALRPVSFPVTRSGQSFTADLLTVEATRNGPRVLVQLRDAAGHATGRADEKLLPREPGRQPCNPTLVGFRLDLAAR